MLYRLLWLLLLAGWTYWLLALSLMRKFFRSYIREEGDFLPPVSVLKPARGTDHEAYENLRSFCRQDYPHFELLVGVNDPEDPYVSLVERLKREFPQRTIRLVVTPPLGANRKVGILHRLAAEARYDILVISDSDTRVTPEYLRRVVAPLADERIGLVTCPYRGEEALSFPAVLEALYIGATFLPSVMVARYVLAMRFALGATVALRARDLEKIGGFASFADYLADDYQLGARLAATGLRVHLADYVVSCILGPTTWRDEWHREVRWARCSRLSRPWGYLGLPLTFSTPWALVFCLGYGWSFPGCAVLAGSLLLRWLVARGAADCLGDRTTRANLFWLPLRDLLTALVWVAGLWGRRVVWRGESFLLHRDGRMEPEMAADRCLAAGS
ncbi:MAG: bacteriohopanetetrol glucosamine biosynthesis glycosyltransferase HpnI [Bacillota bacterium]